MSQFYVGVTEGSLPPSVPTTFETDDGDATPEGNILNILATDVPATGIPAQTTGVDDTVTVEIQLASAIDSLTVDKSPYPGLSSFNNDQFTVVDGFVSLVGSEVEPAIKSINVDASTGDDPVPSDPDGILTITGAQVDSGDVGTNVIRTNSLADNTFTIEIQRSTATGVSNVASNGVSHFDINDFSVDSSGFVQLAGSGAGQTITGDDAVVLSPTLGNWNILGQQAGTVAVVDTVGTLPSTLRVEDRTWTTQYVVDASSTVGLRGTFTTIQAAITAASSPANIFIRPGTYVEDLTLKAGVNLIGYASTISGAPTNTTIRGKHTLSAGIVNIDNINLWMKAVADSILVISGASVTVNLMRCCIIPTNVPAFVLTANSRLNLFGCYEQVANSGNGYLFNVDTSTVNIQNSYLPSAATGACTFVNASGITITNSLVGDSFTTSDTTQTLLYNSTFGTAATWTINGTGVANEAANCEFISTAGAAVSIGTGVTLKLINCTINSTNANPITGAGTVQYAGLSFSNTGSGINTTTQVPRIHSNDAVKVVTPGAYPYTTIPQDAVILVDSSAARTITPLASPTTGQVHTIKDSVGSAAVNNITVTPSGKNIDGAASYTINSNYGSINIVYNGTEWSVV